MTKNGRQTWPNVANTMQNAKLPCQNVANTMQNDRFWFQTVANTRQMVPGKKTKKKPKPEAKTNPKTILHPYFFGIFNFDVLAQSVTIPSLNYSI